MWNNINFVNPWLLLLIPLFLIGWYWANRKTANRIQFLNIPTNKDLGFERSWKERLLFLLPLTAIASIVFLIIALARPQKTLDEEIKKADGIDIVIAMDISSSMLSRDFKPDRLSVAKLVAEEFVDKREFDRIGLVVFSGESFTQCPVTTDHEIVKDFIRNLSIGFLQDGTAIGMGIATAVNRLKDTESKSKIVILMTDGENNSGYIDPETAAEVAKEVGVKLYCIGVGSEGKAMGPINRNLRGEYVFGPVDVNIDEDLLKFVSKETGGKYFRAIDANSLLNIYNEIDRLEKTEIESLVFKKYRELFRWFLTIGICLLSLHLLLKYTILKVGP